MIVCAGLMCALAFAAPVWAVPAPGQRLPVFDITDLAGTVHSTRELRGRRTLVVAITEQGGSDGMAAWGHAADARVPPAVHRVWMVLLNLAFFVPTATARAQARGRTPHDAWADTWFDVHDHKADAADLPGSPVPWAFALDGTGTLVATCHGDPTAPCAEAVWQALGPRQQSRPVALRTTHRAAVR